ncbi:50S ribosomal protein L9 [Aurantimonas sp. C2-6-R+9]|uniref:50S ribosomal protein L9 n=1 Tax=unclassified Aurantimonas TaxID=2638230 RepID=UPI002E1838E1|nr:MULTISPECIES: 50S ribosomal protein L9 [unclassified Aurantimonas]MEC5290663.1 50S ribosomal protein L9 [Aurantimonas sp. C2-3-R2]MEC5380623.1 50S ribosomal protein L9 [Aurantimonas sp. C2-6-R+9]MEC5411669.1 50S ribosomal protein L9 [Aurantimonas sp. C2-4-R8]
MDVILLERIAKLGQMGDTVKVRNGFARNFLLPTGRALRANDANRARFEAEKSQLVARNEERKGEAKSVAATLEGKRFVVVRSAGETGQLYGSVSTRDIADILAGEGFKVGRNEIQLNEPIKRIGLHPITIALHAEVEVEISINVARSPDEAERQARGEELTSADAIYGLDEEESFDDEEQEDGEERDDGEDASGEASASDDTAESDEAQ